MCWSPSYSQIKLSKSISKYLQNSMDSLKQAATCTHIPMMSLCVWTFLKNNNKKINYISTLLQIFNFLIQKWCLKESSFFKFSNDVDSEKKITLSREYRPHMEGFFSLLSLPCRKLLPNATTLSI